MNLEQFAIENIGLLSLLSASAALGALIVASLAAFLTFRDFNRKVGHSVRGYFQLTSSRSSDQKYVSRIVLENTKDKPLVIFGIYLKLSSNLKIALEEFDRSELLTIPAYGIEKRNYDPIVGYSFNMTPIDFEDVLTWENQKAHLLLHTSEGKVRVRNWWPSFNPASEYLRNHARVTARIDRATVEGRGYGNRTKYVVLLKKGGTIVQEIDLNGREAQFKWFRDLGGSEEDLRSVTTVEKLFLNAKSSGKIAPDEIEVFDFQEFLEKRFDWREGEVVTVKPAGWWKTHILGNIATKWRARQLRKKNEHAKNERQRQLAEETSEDSPLAVGESSSNNVD